MIHEDEEYVGSGLKPSVRGRGGGGGGGYDDDDGNVDSEDSFEGDEADAFNL